MLREHIVYAIHEIICDKEIWPWDIDDYYSCVRSTGVNRLHVHCIFGCPARIIDSQYGGTVRVLNVQSN
jgi:hypothetical protein